MATLSVTDVVEAGVTLTLAAAAGGGDVFANDNDNRTFLAVANASGSSITVTVTAQDASENVPGFGTVTKANGGGSVANGATKLFGPFPAAAFNNSSGQVAVTYSSATSVTVAAFKVAKVA